MNTLPEMPDLSALLRGWADRWGGRPAVAGEQGALTFAALHAGADDWAARLRASGCGPGTHVGLLAGNSPQWLAVAFGAWRAGATLVPISTFVSARELGEIIADADIGTLIVQPNFRSHDFLALVGGLPAGVRPDRIIHLDRAGVGDVAASVGAARDQTAVTEIDPESIACILYTSGTTGRAKGVMLSHRAILATVRPTSERTGLTPDDALLSTLPLFWVAGLVIRALPTLATGCALHVMETFTSDGLLAALRSDPATGELPVIMLSARAGEDARVQGLEAGADDYLVKPFSATELLARVASIVQLAHLRRAGEERLALANRELRRHLLEQQTLLDVLPIGIGIATDCECREIRTNRAFAATLGRVADALSRLGI